MWMPSLTISSYSSVRPRRQVRSTVNTTIASTTGNHAPSRNFTPLATRNAVSMMPNRMHSGSTQRRAFGHIARATRNSSRVSISIVPDTDTPYAEANAVELRNIRTRAITASIRIQLIHGM